MICNPLSPVVQLQECVIRLRRNDWVHGKRQISGSYFQMLKNANKQIIILCSYFLPGRLIRNQLLKAAKRGVKVKLIMAGISDVRIAKWAERFIYKALLKNKIDIYEYGPSVLHGKIAVCDREWVTIGSYNINDISAYASIELNLDILDAPFAAEVHQELESIIQKDCRKVTLEDFSKKKNPVTSFLQWVSYETIRLLFYLFTFYFRQKA